MRWRFFVDYPGFIFGLACTSVGRQRVFLRADDQQPQHDGEFGQERWLKRAEQDVVIRGREETGHGQRDPSRCRRAAASTRASVAGTASTRLTSQRGEAKVPRTSR